MSAPNSHTAVCHSCGVREGQVHDRSCAVRTMFAPSGGPADGAKLWLWKNFVDGRPEYWAFANPYPCFGNGDPQVIGSPCGYAILKESKLSSNHLAWTEAEIISEINRAKPARASSVATARSERG